MKKLNDLLPGDILSNQDLGDIFGCGNSGGMRRAKRTNSLLIISSHVKSIYDDRWEGDTLFYTGMGQQGDQNLNFQQNKTLAESNSNGVIVHLFENFKVNQYTYLGQVELCGEPFIELQNDENGLSRKVYIFPLKLKAGERTIHHDDITALKQTRLKKIKKLSSEQLMQLALKAPKEVSQYRTSVTQYVRNEAVVAYAKEIAKGICQLCDVAAPFNDKEGFPYLETHHIVWLARGGEDTIYNTVALCPNCHKRMHVLDLEQDKAKLLAKIKYLFPENPV